MSQKHVSCANAKCGRELRVFTLFLKKYAYCHEHDTYELVPAMPAQLPDLMCRALDALQAINKGEVVHSLNSHAESNVSAEDALLSMLVVAFVHMFWQKCLQVTMAACMVFCARTCSCNSITEYAQR